MMKKLLILGLMALLTLPATGLAAGEDVAIQELQKQIQKLTEELDDLSDRIDVTEKHASLDRINLTGDVRFKAHSLHYKDVTFNPGINVDYTDFFNKVGMSMATGEPLGDVNVFVPDASSPLGMSFDPSASQGSALDNMFVNLYNSNPAMFGQLMNQMGAYMLMGQAPGVGAFPFLLMPDTYDINNDVLYTSRLRLNLKADVWQNVKFNGRLSMYKNWGDSTGTKVFDSWNSFTMDGTNSGNTTSDALHVERAFFDWSNIGGTPLFFSIGRRPSTGGLPVNYRDNELRGGTLNGHLVNFNFDGITIGYGLEDLTGIPGMTARFCYGQGFESEWGNGELYNNLEQTKDTHLGGLNFDLYNDETNFLQFKIFTAQDVNDGFKGTIAFPTELAAIFAPTMYKDLQKFPNFNFVTRVQPSTTIGDMNLAALMFAREEENGIKWFGSAAWTQLRPNGNAGMFGGMGTDAVFQAGLSADGTEVIMEPVAATEDDNENGYGFYAGIQVPAPMGKFGLEYNYGSKYWTPFTQAQDDPIGGKISTRGHVGEAYYIVDINPKMFLKLSGIYYDFKYTGSGSPVGKPQKIEDVQDGTAFSMLPAIDEAYDINASLTLQF